MGDDKKLTGIVACGGGVDDEMSVQVWVKCTKAGGFETCRVGDPGGSVALLRRGLEHDEPSSIAR